MAQKRKRRTGDQNNTNNRRRSSGSQYGGNGYNGRDDESAQRVSSITAEAMRVTADRVAENTMVAADIMHEQAEQFVDELCQQSDLMARQVENFFGRWVKLVTWPMQVTRQSAAATEQMREEQRAA
jgi:polyhydroxyalkanoate synthesis regulator phasin